eukprot:Partr_v1_DN28321_c0_g1_i1_m78954 putative Solute carrier family 25
MQVQGKGNVKYSGIVATLAKVYREEGVRGYFRGNGTNVLRIAPYSAIQFAVYEKMKKVLSPDGVLTTDKRLFAGAVAGVASVASTYPLDMARTRMSVINELGSRKSLGIWSVIKFIYTNEGGMRGLYRGLSPTTLGVAPYVAFNFAVYEGMKGWFADRGEVAEPSVAARLLCGGLAGTVAQTATYPLDLIRRRFQVMAGGDYGYQYRSTWDAFRTILRQEGVAGLFKGTIPNILKVAPAMSVSFVTYEQCKKWMA